MAANQYIIEELHAQDDWSVIFEATDTSTNVNVWLHRFFPHGNAAVGLDENEMQQFLTAMSFMREWSHPALLKIYDGGYDAQDFIPFIVREPISGDSLATLLLSDYLTMAQGRKLAQQALELIIEMESNLGGGAGWLMLDPENIAAAKDGMDFRFSINPACLINKKQDQTSLRNLLSLVEISMGWTGRLVTGSTLGTLSGWVRETRSKNYNPTAALALLHGNHPEGFVEVDQHHADDSESINAAAPRVTALLHYGDQPQLQPRVELPSMRKKSSLPWILVAASVTAGVAALLYVKSIQKPNASSKDKDAITKTTSSEIDTKSAADSTPATELSAEEKRRQEIHNKALEMQKSLAIAEPPKKELATIPPKQTKVYTQADFHLIAEQEGKTVTLEGKVTAVMDHQKKYRYIKFEGATDNEICGRYPVKTRARYMSLDYLKRDLVGKNISLSGVVQKEPINNGSRYAIEVLSRKDIKISSEP